MLTKGTEGLDDYLKKFGVNFKNRHQDWTSRIINLCKPKIIIYEGKKLSENCPPSNTYTIRTEQKGRVIIYDFKNNIKGLMYSRSYPQSGIKNIDEFSEILKTELSKIYN